MELINEFCTKNLPQKSNVDEFKSELVELLKGVQEAGSQDYFNLFLSEFREIKEELKYLRSRDDELQQMVKDSSDSLIQEFEKTSKKKSSKVDYGVFSSKIAKEFADENGINGDDIEGTGKDGKVTKKDIQKQITSVSTNKKSQNSKKSPKTKKPCNGVKESDGSLCKNSGSILISGKWYCKKHKSQGEVLIETEDEYSDIEDEDQVLDIDENVDDEIKKFREDSIKSNEEYED